MRLPSTIAGFALVLLPLAAQWQEVKTKRVPLTRDGKPNLTAPAPKLADGKTPDLSGIWNSIKTPCEQSATAQVRLLERHRLSGGQVQRRQHLSIGDENGTDNSRI